MDGVGVVVLIVVCLIGLGILSKVLPFLYWLFFVPKKSEEEMDMDIAWAQGQLRAQKQKEEKEVEKYRKML